MPPIPFASVRSDSRDVLFWPPSGDVTMPPSGKVDIDFCVVFRIKEARVSQLVV